MSQEYEVEVTAEVKYLVTIVARSPEEAENEAEAEVRAMYDDGPVIDFDVVESVAFPIEDEPLEEEDDDDTSND